MKYTVRCTYVGTKAILKGWKSNLFVILVNFLAPGSGFAFAIRIRLRIQESQLNADPNPKH
jgi:hypothetical protein